MDQVSVYEDTISLDLSSVTEVIIDFHEKFSIDATQKMMRNLAAGKSADQAKTMITYLEKRLSTADEPKDEKTDDDLHGRGVLEMTQNQIIKCGKVMVAVVNSGIDLPAFSNEIISIVGMDDNKIRSLRTIKEQVFTQPDQSVFKLKAKIMVNEFAYNSIPAPSDDQIEEYKIRVQNEKDIEFMDAYEKWQSNINQQNRAKEDLFEIVSDKEKLVVLEIVVQALISAGVIIVSKIKRALKDYPKIVKKMKGSVSVGDKRITDPYSSDNLSGLYAKLHDEYGSNSIVSFSSSLVGMLRKKASNDEIRADPMTPIMYAEAYMKEWEQRDLFKMMTPDIFFSAITMNMIPSNTELYRNVTTEFLKHQKELLKNPASDEYENFNFIKSYIKDVFCQSKEMIESANYEKVPDSRGGNNNGSNRNRNYSTNYNNSNSRGGYETAASVQEIPKNNYSPRVIAQSENIGKEITRGDNRGIVIKDRKYPYTATRNPCPKCSGSQGGHEPKCWMYQCQKCKLFGHKADFCVQVQREAAHSTASSGVLNTADGDEELQK